MTGRILAGPDDLAEGTDWLIRREPRFAVALEVVGEVPLRRRPDGFAALLWAITGQQVSTSSAQATWARLEAAGMTDPAQIAAGSEETLRGLGLSRQKARYAMGLAFAGLDYASLADLPDEAVIARLTELPGIGRWTAEIYAAISLGRADVLAAGDLALQEAARQLFSLETRPSEADLRAMAAPWSPWRGVAARLLWAYYRVTTKREGISA